MDNSSTALLRLLTGLFLAQYGTKAIPFPRMKFFVAVVVLIFVVQLVCGQEDKKPKEISKSLETLNVDELLQNARYVETQVNCVLERGKCDRTGRELTDILPEYFQRKCEACSESQRTKTDKISAHVSQHHPEDWALIVQKYS